MGKTVALRVRNFLMQSEEEGTRRCLADGAPPRPVWRAIGRVDRCAAAATAAAAICYYMFKYIFFKKTYIFLYIRKNKTQKNIFMYTEIHTGSQRNILNINALHKKLQKHKNNIFGIHYFKIRLFQKLKFKKLLLFC